MFCKHCNLEKEATAFYPYRRSKCKACSRAKMRENYRIQYAKDPQKFANSIKRNTTLTERSTYVYHSIIRKKYGLEPEDYEKMLQDQGGLCWICKAPPKRCRLAVDHCHKTGKVRGLLCWHCNYRLLPAARENVNTLLKAAEYLTKSKN